MIIIVCTDDQKLVDIAQISSSNNPQIFGNTYRIFNQIPRLLPGENLFVIAHGAYNGDDNNPVIGDRKNDFYVNAVDFFDNIKSIFPNGYTGSVYIDACESADHTEETMSFAEVFLTQIQVYHGQTRVFGRKGKNSGLIPLPADLSWGQATL
ncbi:hypothetical protein [Rheinheimera sp.]|uniref:hypothetical protein n=1 Tax=Rheinheimera sp. TaxID=1869214 RepID=UPI002732694B|nr:hypothetical protein [Rheinheimera sp.]MDP2713859.1 hypothetical protein [Rheinheimera sp.]